MSKLSAIWNDAGTPPLQTERVLRLRFDYTTDNPDVYPPFQIHFVTDIAGVVDTQMLNFPQTSPNVYQLEIVVPSDVFATGGIVSFEIVDAGNNSAGEFAGAMFYPAPPSPDVSALVETELQALESTGVILRPRRRAGTLNLRQFNVFNTIYRNGGHYEKRDLDFIDVQLRSVAQAAQKCRTLILAGDPHTTAIYRTRANKTDEYGAHSTTEFRDYVSEIARIMDYAVAECRDRQKFILSNDFFIRSIEL